ncbi:hypothetical protein [Krasilnikovia sp. MM14-A1259]|uniref:hypothetical protein n=1 Tax=Krasilnikovia sp. MM14-A1259 TaxID=3373539 RepID=UPI003812BF69
MRPSTTGGKGGVTRGTAAISSEPERVWEGRDFPETRLIVTPQWFTRIDNGHSIRFDVHEYAGAQHIEFRLCCSLFMIPTTM